MNDNKEKQPLTHVKHEFEPIYDETSRILILGTFPSVKSREQNFYYGHPQNRFWKTHQWKRFMQMVVYYAKGYKSNETNAKGCRKTKNSKAKSCK